MKMRRIVAVLMAVLMLACIIPATVTADTSATIDFTDIANRVSCSTSQQVWEQNGITVTNDKGASTSNVNEKYFNPVRCYKSSTVTIEYPGMTTIVIDSVTFDDNDYAIGWTNSFSADATATVVDGDVTIVLAQPADSFTWETLTSQSRAYSITVYTDGSAPVVPPVEPDVPSDDPEVDTELSIADAIALGASKEHNTYTEGKYFVTGIITEVYNVQYGNMKLTDEAGNILTIYGTYNEDGTIRYDEIEDQPVAGDTVTIYGIVGQYNGIAQIKNGWIVEHTVGNGEIPGTPDVPSEPAVGVVDAPVAGTAYKFGMIQGNVSATDVYYLIGGMNGFYMATGTDVNAAIDVYLEATEGGYYCYAMADGVKTYINMVVSGTHVNGAYEATASTVYTYDADAKTIVANVDGAPYWFGTRNDKTYTTVGPCKTEYEGFYCQFYAVTGGETPDTPDVPDIPANDTLTIEEAIALGQTMEHNTFTEEKYYVTGVITEVYNTMYGNMRLADEAGNILTIYGTFSADGELRYDAMDVKPVAGDTVTIYGIVGQYNGNSQIKNGWIVKHTAGGETPDEPEVPDEPELPTGDTLTIEEAIALGQTMEHNTFTEQKYYVSGVISEVYNEMYGNMRLTDEAGNILTIYGTFSADGELRYDAMDVKPVAGDTVTIYGIVGQYNGTSQIKNGWIVKHTANGETPEQPDEPEQPEQPAVEVVDVPSADVAYKFGMIQSNLEGKVFYLAGGMSGYYMATTEDVNAALDVYLEETEGGYYCYAMVDGVKTYINMVVSGNFVNGAYEEFASTVYTYDADAKTLVADIDGIPYWFGTRNDNTYTTMGPCKVEYAGFYGMFYAISETPDEPEQPEEPVDPEIPADPEDPAEPEQPADPEEPDENPSTGDNSTVFVMVAVVLMALAAAVMVLTAKKRA